MKRVWNVGRLIVAGIGLVLLFSVMGESGEGASPGFSLGRESTWFRVQNISSTSSTIGAEYLAETGAHVAQDTYSPVQAGRSAAPFFQQDNALLPPGFRGSAAIFSDQRVDSLLFRSIKNSANLYRYGGLATTLPVPAKRVYLPLVQRNFGYHDSWNTRIIVMNTSPTTSACIGISYWKAGGSAPGPVPRDPADYGQCISIPPLGTIRRDVNDMTVLGNQWLGSVMVDVVGAENPPGSKQIIVAYAETWNRERGTFASYTGLCWKYPNTCPSGAGASTQVYLPLIYRSFGKDNQWESYVMIQTHDNQTSDVEIQFTGWVGDTPFETTYGPFEVKTSRICYLSSSDPVSACSDAGMSNGALPVGFIGSARVLEPTGSVPLAVIATRASNRFDNHSTYSAFWERIVNGTAGPPHKVYVPLVYRNYGWHGPSGSAKGWNSWFQVQVADGGTANLNITYYKDAGSVADTESIAVDRSGTIPQAANTALGGEFIGSAVIESDKPIAVVVTVTSDAYIGDADASYEGQFP